MLVLLMDKKTAATRAYLSAAMKAVQTADMKVDWKALMLAAY